MEFRTIRQTSHIDGVNKNPGLSEHNKALVWDNDLQKVKYVLYSGQVANSNISDGFVTKGNDATSGEYIWKLDINKNPAWRKEEYLKTITKSGNHSIFTMNSGSTIEVPFGALAWVDTLSSAVTSVFGRTGVVTAQSGDYTASQITNAFDKTIDDLDDIKEGAVNKHFTATDKSNLNLNTVARHSHSNKSILDLITDAGGGVIPTAGQIYEWDTFTDADKLNIINTIVAFIKNNTGITWTYDNILLTFTPTINLGAFTTDNLPAGNINKYYIESAYKNVFTIVLPANSTVAGRCSAPIHLPTGWSVAASGSGVDLLVTHNLGRKVVDVKVFSVDGTSGAERMLLNNAAYSGVVDPTNLNDSVIIEALATITTNIVIHITLASLIV